MLNYVEYKLKYSLCMTSQGLFITLVYVIFPFGLECLFVCCCCYLFRVMYSTGTIVMFGSAASVRDSYNKDSKAMFR